MTRTGRDYNYFLLGCVVVLTGFSMAMIYSATLTDTNTHDYFSRHLVNLIVGAVAMVLLTALDYHAFLSWSRPLYLGTIAILGVVMVLGHVRGGAQSWLDLPLLRTFQPSEPAKLAIIIALAAFWQRFEKDGGAWKAQLGGLLLAGIPMAMVFIQPDFGTAMVIAAIWLMIAWTAGLRWWQIALLLVAAVPIAYYGWTHVLEDYQKARILVFVDLRYDPNREHGAWNIIQSLNAIGSGGLTGRGWTHGPMTQGNYIPVQYSDFIFATAGEELGFVGTAILLLFEIMLVWQALVIAGVARDTFGRLIAVGIAAMFLCHVLVNAGMNMSIMPITGIPLPFISYGGSFNMTALAAVGLLQSVALKRRRIVF